MAGIHNTPEYLPPSSQKATIKKQNQKSRTNFFFLQTKTAPFSLSPSFDKYDGIKSKKIIESKIVSKINKEGVLFNREKFL